MKRNEALRSTLSQSKWSKNNVNIFIDMKWDSYMYLLITSHFFHWNMFSLALCHNSLIIIEAFHLTVWKNIEKKLNYLLCWYSKLKSKSKSKWHYAHFFQCQADQIVVYSKRLTILFVCLDFYDTSTYNWPYRAECYDRLKITMAEQ
jgi:hypothetical protein